MKDENSVFKELEMTPRERREKIKELCERFNVKEYMGELFVSELAKSKLIDDLEAVCAAKTLGLI